MMSTSANTATSARSDTPPLPGREAFPHFLTIPTRWMDNDVYGHVNNVVYYSYFDTVINEYLIREGGLDIRQGTSIGYCVESQCRYLAALAFPEVIDAGLRVAHLGTSSVRYEIGLFQQGAAQPAAVGSFVHVFVARENERPTPMPGRIRSCLQRLSRQNAG